MKTAIDGVIKKILSIPMTETRVIREIAYNQINGEPTTVTSFVYCWLSENKDTIEATVKFIGRQVYSINLRKTNPNAELPIVMSIVPIQFELEATSVVLDDMLKYSHAFPLKDEYSSFV